VVEILEPVIRGAAVMGAVPPPFLLDLDQIVELPDEAWLGMMPPVKKCCAIQSAPSPASKR
jgi:hypothetical protein